MASSASIPAHEARTSVTPLSPLQESVTSLSPLQESVTSLSPLQEMFRLLAELTPERSPYHAHRCLRLRGPLDHEALRDALRAVAARHPALRCRVVTTDRGGAGLVLRPPGAVDLDVRDLSRTRDPMGQALREAAEVTRRPFSIDQAPLWRAALWRLGEHDHLFLWCAQPICCDDRSAAVVLGELASCYSALPREVPEQPWPATSALQPGPADGTAGGPADGTMDGLAAYWRERMGKAEDLDLATDLPRPARPSFRGALARRRLDDATAKRVAALGRTAGADPLTGVLAAYATLLGKYTGAESIVVGVPHDDRPSGGAVGCFTTDLPVRVDLDGASSFRQLLERVAGEVREARQHAALPFLRIVDVARPARDPFRAPLFQVAAAVDDEQVPPMAGLRVERHRLDTGTAQLDLTVVLRRLPDAWELLAEFSADILITATVERFLAQLANLLEMASQSPDRPLAEFTPRAPGEAAVLAHDWGGPPVDPDLTVPELVAAQAAATPDAIAVEAPDGRLTFAELDHRANRLAHLLREHGAGPDRQIALCLPRTADLLMTVLAILKAGAAYLPLDSTLPAERIRYMLQAADPVVVLAHSSLADRVPRTGTPVLLADRLAGRLNAMPGEAPPATAGPDNLAFILFTSGSTGRPKGVAMPHRALANLAQWQRSIPRDTAGGAGRTFQLHSMVFDVASQELFSTWLAGGTLVLADERERTDIELVLRALGERRITTLYLPCAALVELAHAAEMHGVVPADLRDVYQAGEQLTITPDLRAFFEKMPQCRLHNQYGPTEAGPICSHLTLRDRPADWPELPAIGMPIANTRCYVLGPDRRPVPAGGVGTLHVAGAQVARGYIGRDDLTRERFAEVTAAGPADRAYDTGDLVRVDPYGRPHFLGRRDTQVKLRGYRIELGEIETALAAHPAVAQAAVVLRTVASRPALVAYWIPAEAAAEAEAEAWPDKSAFAEFLGQSLPAYVVPAHYVRLDHFPRTASGKIDRSALPDPADAGTPAADDPPVTSFEEVVAEAFRIRLGAAAVGRHDRFFDLGGHSLSALDVVAEIQARSGVRLSAASLLRNASVAEIGTELERLVLDTVRASTLRALLDEVEGTER
jgi:amino acid adenylation domain-containing protein